MLTGLVCCRGISDEAQPELRTQVRSSTPYKRRRTHPRGLERETELSRGPGLYRKPETWAGRVYLKCEKAE